MVKFFIATRGGVYKMRKRLRYSDTKDRLLSFLLMFITALSNFSIASTIQTQFIQDHDNTYAQGEIDGKKNAKGNPLWLLPGIGCCIFGVGAAAISVPNPRPEYLSGKSSDYIQGFTDGYKSSTRKRNLIYASIGAVITTVYILSTGETSSSSHSSGF